MKKSAMAGVAAAAVAAVLVVGWAFAPRPVDVDVAQAKEGRFEAGVEEEAKTRLRDRYVVSAPLAGLLDRIALREGDPVQVNDAVAALTPLLSPMLDARTLREQQARLEGAEANVQRVQARIAGAQVALQQARNEVARSEELSKQGFVAPTKLDTDRLAVEAASKELEAAQQEKHVAVHDVEQARAALAAVQGPSPGRSFVLRAPVSGVVLKVMQPSEATVALGTPLIELGDTSRLEVVGELLTTDALKARPGSRVVIDRWGGEGTLEGRVRLVEPGAFTKVSALGVEEQRVRVLIDITSPPERWRALGDGYRVGIHVVTRQADKVLKVPVGAVFPAPSGDGMAVFRIDGGKARQVPVKIAARNESEAWIEKGLASGDEVIVYPPASVKDGARVRRRP